MSGSSNEGGKVGYGRPPQHTRFQKGRSGNPAGRPRRHSKTTIDVAALLNEPVAVEHKGQSRSMTPFEIGLRQLTKRALGDADVRAALKLIDLFQKHGHITPRPPAVQDQVLVAPASFGPDEWHIIHAAYMRTRPTSTSADLPTAQPTTRRTK